VEEVRTKEIGEMVSGQNSISRFAKSGKKSPLLQRKEQYSGLSFSGMAPEKGFEPKRAAYFAPEKKASGSSILLVKLEA
jgi:hypothetical protein